MQITRTVHAHYATCHMNFDSIAFGLSELFRSFLSFRHCIWIREIRKGLSSLIRIKFALGEWEYCNPKIVKRCLENYEC